MNKSLLTSVLLLAFSFSAFSQVVSDFSSNADGWTVFDSNAGSSVAATYNSSGGNPGGYVSFTTSSGSVNFFWTAPAKFNGNLSSSYNQNLTFDLKQSTAGTDNATFDIMLQGSGGTLEYQLPTKPSASGWSSYSIPLNEAQWHNGCPTCTAPNQTQMKQTLATVTKFQIRLKYLSGNTGPYTAQLDNVVFNQVNSGTPPVITSFTPSGALAGAAVTITGANLNSTASLNAVYFNGVMASVTNAASNQLIVKVPTSAVFGPITVENLGNGLQGTSTQSFNPLFDNNKDFGGRIIPASMGRGYNVVLPMSSPASNSFGRMDKGDLDGDGRIDLVTTETSTAKIYAFRNLGSSGSVTASSFSSAITLPSLSSSIPGGTAYLSEVLVVDVDNDGKLDVAASTANNTTGFLAVYRNTSTSGSVSFAAPAFFAYNYYSSLYMAAGDLDGDGRTDFAFTTGTSPGNIFLSQNLSTPGNIDFAFGVSLSAVSTSGLSDIAIADLSGDGKPEIICPGYNAATISIYQNNSTTGTISMGAAFTIPSVVSYTNQIAVADLDADGKLDMTWSTYGSQYVYFTKNIYSGGAFDATAFGATIQVANTLSNPLGITVGDVNGDSKPDVIMSGYNDLAILQNVGTSGNLNSTSFLPTTVFQGSATAASIFGLSPVVADLDGDNKSEAIFVSSGGSLPVGATGIYIFHNESYPAPTIASTSPVSSATGNIVSINGDLMYTGNKNPSVRLNKSLATITGAITNTLTKVVLPGEGVSGKFSVTNHGLTAVSPYFNKTFATTRVVNASSFGPSVDFALSGNLRDALEVADFDDDGKTDVVVVDNFSTTKIFQNASTAGQPISASSLSLQSTTYTAGYNVTAFDIDGDGKTDLNNGYGLLQNNSPAGAISFLSGPNGVYTYAGGYNQSAVADFNMDGKIDMALTNGTASIQIFENQSSNGVFVNNSYLSTIKTNGVSLSKPNTYGGVVAEDFDGDGYTDLISTNQTAGNMTFYLNTKQSGPITSSSFSFLGNYSTSGSQPIGITANDFDGDGRMDMAVTYYNSAFVSVYRNMSSLGDISFASPVDLVSANKGYNITSQDLDGDGKAEIVVIHQPNPGPGSFSVFQNKSTSGSLSFNPVVNVTLTRNPQAVNIADINLDQKPDILIVANSGVVGNALMVFENKMTSNTITVTQQPVNPNNKCVGTNFTFSTDAIGTTNITFQWQKYNTSTLQFEDLANDATYSGATTKNLLINNIQLAQDGDYRCVINGDFANTVYCNTGTLTVHALPPTPVTTNGQRCDPGQVVVSASGAADGEFVWYEDGTNGEPIANENNSIYTTPVISTSTTYYVTIVNAYCETARTPVQAMITNVTAPSATGAGLCSNGSVTLNASGGTNGQYRWYTVSAGGTAIAGEVNSTYTTPSLTSTTDYFVAINNGTCESPRTLVTATITTVPASPAVIGSAACGASSVTLTASGATNGQYRWYTVSTGGTAIPGEVNSTYVTPVVNASTDFYVAINNGACEGPRAQVTATINTSPAAPTTTGASACSTASLNLSAAGGVNGQYRWYTILTGGTAIAGEVNSSYTTPSINSTTNYYVSITDGTCESARTLVTATINSIPTAPTVATASACGSASITLTASGATNGQYRWYTVLIGGTAIAGEVNSTYTTPTISATTDYYVSINNGKCESLRTLAKATINTVPAAPAVTPGSACGPNVAITVTASGGTNGQYRWYTVSTGGTAMAGEVNAIYTTPALNSSTTYFVAINDGTCESARTSVLAEVKTCVTNQPPAIKPADVSIQIEGVVTLNLLSLLSDPDNNLDLTKLAVVVQPKSGAIASIDANQNLIIDYKNLPFSGVDKLTIEVCDLAGSCTQQEISVEVIGDIVVFNGVSPNNDGLNDRFELRYIDVIENTKNNHVSIFNRWGSKVFDISNYNNTTRVFTGHNENGDELPAGTYFYKIEFASGKEMKTGYLTLKR